MSERSYKKLENGQIVSPIPVTEIPGDIYDALEYAGKKFLTWNSRCPCGSGKRYKRCHGIKLKSAPQGPWPEGSIS